MAGLLELLATSCSSRRKTRWTKAFIEIPRSASQEGAEYPPSLADLLTCTIYQIDSDTAGFSCPEYPSDNEKERSLSNVVWCAARSWI